MPWSSQAPGMSFVGVEELDMRVSCKKELNRTSKKYVIEFH
jgi:hypothetical protein